MLSYLQSRACLEVGCTNYSVRNHRCIRHLYGEDAQLQPEHATAKLALEAALVAYDRRYYRMRIICLTAAIALAGILAFALGGSIAILAHGVPTVSHVTCTNPSN